MKMTSVFRSMLPAKIEEFDDDEDDDDDYSVNYSFAMEYSGPPVSQDIPQVVPIDIRRIPTASVAARAVTSRDFSLPVVQPIARTAQSKKNGWGESNSGSETSGRSSNVGSSVRVRSGNSWNVEDASAAVESRARKPNGLGSSPSSSDGDALPKDSSHLLEHSDVDVKSLEVSSENSSFEEVEDCVVEPSALGNRTAAVTFRDSPSIDSISRESDEGEHENFPERPIASNDLKKGSCYKCHKRNRFAEKEVCLVCGAKYCKNCLLRAMGSMPEGRKCITCIGYPIDESRRGSLGKRSGMLKKLLASDAVNQIMSSELSCEANQLPSYLICVNGKPLSIGELLKLQSCPNPPKKLKPGKYWYDKVSGFWGKVNGLLKFIDAFLFYFLLTEIIVLLDCSQEGEKPSQLISAELAVGYRIAEDASNGDTNVLINNRRITKAEIWMLQVNALQVLVDFLVFPENESEPSIT